MNLFLQAIRNLRPNSAWKVVGNDNYENLEWLDTEQIKPTENELNTEIERLQSEYDKLEYQRLRVAEYPPIVEQLDKIFHEGIDAWKSEIQAIKDKYPKAQ
jgi:hypothetical protein